MAPQLRSLQLEHCQWVLEAQRFSLQLQHKECPWESAYLLPRYQDKNTLQQKGEFCVEQRTRRSAIDPFLSETMVKKNHFRARHVEMY